MALCKMTGLEKLWNTGSSQEMAVHDGSQWQNFINDDNSGEFVLELAQKSTDLITCR